MAVQVKPVAQFVVIKKCASRRLYDTARRAYITQDDLLDYVRTREPFQIVATPSGNDVTREVLLNLLCEVELEREEPRLSITEIYELLTERPSAPG